MFDFVNNHKKIIQVLLAIVFLPFAFFGVDSYFRSIDSGNDVATVSGQAVTQEEFTRGLQEQQTMRRSLLGPNANPALLDSPEIRANVLDGIVRQRLLLTQALRNRVFVSDQQLVDFVSQIPAFQEGGKFSPAIYNTWLRNNNTTEKAFDERIRRDLMVERLSDAYSNTATIPTSVVERLLRITAQQREVSQSTVEPEKFTTLVKLEDGAAKQYYDTHQSELQVPERARLEYLEVSLDDLAAQVPVAAEDVKQFYEQNLQRYSKGEERQASHILIEVKPNASAQEKQGALAKAEQLLKQVKQNPSSFAETAKKNSQDPVSAAKGGDLGFAPRGAMLKPFDDAVFQMKTGEIGGPVETQYGYHIIRLTAIKGQAYDDVKKQVEVDLRRAKAGKIFSELGEQFREKVFTENDSLKPAAEMLKTSVHTSGWVSRAGNNDNKQFNNPKLLQVVFSDDTVHNKRNTDVVDVGDNTLIAARVVEYKAASVRPFEEVSADITKRLTQQQAVQLAAQSGREMLAKLKQGAEVPGVNWNSGKLISRENPQGYSGPVLAEVFKADAGKLPAYAGVEGAQGAFVLLKVTRVVEQQTVDIARRKGASEQLQQLLGQEQLAAYLAGLKLKAEVKVRQERLEKKEP